MATPATGRPRGAGSKAEGPVQGRTKARESEGPEEEYVRLAGHAAAVDTARRMTATMGENPTLDTCSYRSDLWLCVLVCMRSKKEAYSM